MMLHSCSFHKVLRRVSPDAFPEIIVGADPNLVKALATPCPAPGLVVNTIDARTREVPTQNTFHKLGLVCVDKERVGHNSLLSRTSCNLSMGSSSSLVASYSSIASTSSGVGSIYRMYLPSPPGKSETASATPKIHQILPMVEWLWAKVYGGPGNAPGVHLSITFLIESRPSQNRSIVVIQLTHGRARHRQKRTQDTHD
jgi:hypothetical protein